MLGEQIASQSGVVRAIVSEYSPCCGVPHHVVVHLRVRPCERRRRLALHFER